MFFKNEAKVEFLKEDSNVGDYINELEEKLRNTASGQSRQSLERAIHRAKRGQYGENAVANELKQCRMDMYVLRDIGIEYREFIYQIDFIVVTRKNIYVLECKNLESDVKIDEDGGFTYVAIQERGKENKYENTDETPINQNRKHKEALERLWDSKKNMLTKSIKIKPLVVFANKKAFLDVKYAEKEIRDQVVRLDRLCERIQKMDAMEEKNDMSISEMKKTANFFKKNNSKRRPDYTKKYEEVFNRESDRGNMLHPNVPYKKRYITSNIERPSMYPKRFCPKCKAELVIKTATKGEHKGKKFYGCTNYPKCTYLEDIQ